MDNYVSLTVKQLKEKLTEYKIKGISALKKEALLTKLFIVEFERNILNSAINSSTEFNLDEANDFNSSELSISPRKQRYISSSDKKDTGTILGNIKLNSMLKSKNIDLSNIDTFDIVWFHNRLNYEGLNSYLLLKCEDCFLGQSSINSSKSVYIYINILVNEDKNEEIVMTFHEDVASSLGEIINSFSSKIEPTLGCSVLSLYMKETEPLEHIYQGSDIVLENGVIVKINGRNIAPRYTKNGNDIVVESRIKSSIIYIILNYLYIDNYTTINSSETLNYDSLANIDTIFWTHFTFNDSSKFNYVLYSTNKNIFTLLKFRYDFSSMNKRFFDTSVYLSHKIEDIILYGMNKHEYDLYEQETYSV